jgi:uncharacterized protein YqeY
MTESAFVQTPTIPASPKGLLRRPPERGLPWHLSRLASERSRRRSGARPVHQGEWWYVLAMAIVDELKTRMTEAMRGKDDVTKNIYRLAYSEMQLASARSGKDVSDDEAIAILKKLVKSNEETLAVATEAAQKEALAREIALLTAMLPKTLGVPEIVAALAPVAEAIRAAGNDGQATGVAMKHLKATGASVDGKTVAAAVKQIRS